MRQKLLLLFLLLAAVHGQFRVSQYLEDQANNGKRCAREMINWLNAHHYTGRNRYVAFKDSSYPMCDDYGDYITKHCDDYSQECKCVSRSTNTALYTSIGRGQNSRTVLINRQGIGAFFDAEFFSCDWFSPSQSRIPRRTNLGVFCDANWTGNRWCVDKDALECVDMSTCGNDKVRCNCTDDRCFYLTRHGRHDEMCRQNASGPSN
jgi:hypothetical protein